MALDKAFVFRIGADISTFTKSISQVEDELNSLKSTLKDKVGTAILETNKDIKTLETSLSALKNAGGKASGGVDKAAYSLTTMGGVVRDLPFGFIAIQNNLPMVVDSFSNLARESGGVGKAFKNLGSSMLGPAGIGFAFGAVTSLITLAVQKYGSLGNAMDAIFSKNGLLIEAQNAYTKSLGESSKTTASETSQIKILIGAISNMDLPLKKRQAAYIELKKIQPDIVAGVTKEGIASAINTKIIVGQGGAYMDLLKIKVQMTAVNAALDKTEIARQAAAGKYVAERNKLDVLTAERDALAKLADQSNKTSIVVNQSIGGVMISNTGTAKVRLGLVNKAIEEQKSVLSEASVEYGAADKVQQKYYNQLKPLIDKISEYDAKVDSLTESLKKLNKENTEDARDAGKKAREDRLQNIKDYKEELKDMYANMKGELVVMPTLGASKLDLEKTFKKPDLSTYQDSYTKMFEKLSKTSLEFDPTKMTKGLDEKRLGELDKMVKKYDKTKQQLEQVFFQPLQNLFETFLTTGKLTFADFAKAVISAISAIVAKIIATAVIDLLLKIIDPTGTAAAASKATGATGGIADLIVGLFGKSGAMNNSNLMGGGSQMTGSMNNANVGSLSPGGITMNGSVNMVLRGSDLVGAVNRTNSQISRVG